MEVSEKDTQKNNCRIILQITVCVIQKNYICSKLLTKLNLEG